MGSLSSVRYLVEVVGIFLPRDFPPRSRRSSETRCARFILHWRRSHQLQFPALQPRGAGHSILQPKNHIYKECDFVGQNWWKSEDVNGTFNADTSRIILKTKGFIGARVRAGCGHGVGASWGAIF